MAKTPSPNSKLSTAEQDQMHDVYRQGGEQRQMAPQVVYVEENCPHPGCGQHLQAIDFPLEAHGKKVHDPLVRAWWNDKGFAGQCPGCGNWIHYYHSRKESRQRRGCQTASATSGKLASGSSHSVNWVTK